VEVYLLEFKDPKGGSKKHVVASVHCRLYLEGEDQSRGSAAGQNGGSGDRNSELSRHTRSGGGLVEPSPSASVMKGQSAARVRWVLRCGMSKWSYHFAALGDTSKGRR
jgi:hypothetical protein